MIRYIINKITKKINILASFFAINRYIFLWRKNFVSVLPVCIYKRYLKMLYY